MAKPAPEESTPAPKKRRQAAAAGRRRQARRINRPRAARANPAGGDLTAGAGEDLKTIGVGIGAYAGTRLLQRAAVVVIGKKRPSWRKHLHVAAGVVAFGAAWIACRKVKALAPYHTSALLGTGVAAAQGFVTAYVPKYAWVFSDVSPESLRALPAGSETPTAAGDYLDELEELAELERSQGRQPRPRSVQANLQAAAQATGDTGIDPSLLEHLDVGEGVDDLYGGVFEDPTLYAN